MRSAFGVMYRQFQQVSTKSEQFHANLMSACYNENFVIIWHTHPLLGNDHEINNETTAAAT
jgi:hypothetical protein